MKYINVVGALLVMFALNGCATSSDVAYAPDEFMKSEPEINSINTVKNNETVFKKGLFVESQIFVVDEEVIIDSGAPSALNSIVTAMVGNYVIHPGKYPQTGENQFHHTYKAQNGESGYVEKTNKVLPDAQSILVKKKQDKVCVDRVERGFICKKVPNLAEVTRTIKQENLVLASNGRLEELKFSGYEEGKLLMTYYIFFKTLESPVRERKVEFDLSESKTIEFKGLSLEVLEVSKQQLTYKLLSGFDGLEESSI